MKDSRFIELVNLYIDRQITAAETAELEAQIQANAKHRQIYQQYCRMNRASSLVFENFRVNADIPQVAAGREVASIAHFATNRRRSLARWYYAAAGMAAAACVAIVVVQRQRPELKSEVVAANFVPVTQVASVPASVQPGTVSETPVANAVTLAEQQYAALLAAKRQEEIRAFALNQQKVSKPLSLFEDGELYAGATMLTVDGKVYYPRSQPAPRSSETTEFTAFQFQR